LDDDDEDAPGEGNKARGEPHDEPVNKEVYFDEDDEGYEGNYEEEADDKDKLKAFKARRTNQRFNTLESKNRTNQVEARARHEGYLRIKREEHIFPLEPKRAKRTSTLVESGGIFSSTNFVYFRILEYF
jgi:hypothetical protein